MAPAKYQRSRTVKRGEKGERMRLDRGGEHRQPDQQRKKTRERGNRPGTRQMNRERLLLRKLWSVVQEPPANQPSCGDCADLPGSRGNCEHDHCNTDCDRRAFAV